MATSPVRSLSIWLIAFLSGLPHVAVAQGFGQYLYPEAPGYDFERGALIQQRPRSEYDPLGVQAGGFTIRPRLDESTGYQTNVTGTAGSPGSWIVGTTPSVDILSGFGRNSIGANFGLNDQQYLDQKSQTHVDWNASLGGTYQIGNDVVTGAVSETYVHQLQSNLGLNSFSLDKPLGFKATSLRLSYDTTPEAALRFEPNFAYNSYRFDPVTLPGSNISEKANDRDEYVGGLTVRYGAAPARSLVAVFRFIDTIYVAALGGTARPNTLAYESLVGVDYALSGNLQALLLVGYEYRDFIGGHYPNNSSPVAEATIIWTPTGLTTLTGHASRTIQDTVGTTSTGVTLTQGGVTIDHEYTRNWLLQGRTSILFADYGYAGSTQTVYGLGASATYLVNRNLRVVGSYDFSSLNSPQNTSSTAAAQTVLNTTGSILPQNNLSSATGSFNAHTITVTLRFAL